MKTPFRFSHAPRLTWRHACLALAAFCLCSPAGLFATSFSISPQSLTNDYTGDIKFLVVNFPSGTTVRLDEFLDLNTNGLVDATDLLIDSFQVTDGQASLFGGTVDGNIPGDLDGIAGQITTTTTFANKAEISQVAGSHLFRLSSPTSAFASVVVPFTVYQPAFPQGISGLVTNGVSGASQTVVGVASGVTGRFLAGALTDPTGHYALKLATGTYGLFSFKQGYLSPFGSPEVVVSASQITNQNLAISAGARTISGAVTDASTGAGLPAVQLMIQSTTTNMAGLATTDAGGKFSFSAAPDQYKLEISDRSLQQLGYLRPATKPKANVTSGNLTGMNLALNKATAMIYGTLKTDANLPLAGVSIGAGDTANLYASSTLTDTNGAYAVAVLGGTSWNIGPDNTSPALQGYTVDGTNLNVGANQAALVDFVASKVTAHILGRVIDNTGTGQAGLTLFASLSNGTASSATTSVDGSFDLGVFGGTWEVMLATGSNGAHNWLVPSLNVAVADGVNVSNLDFIVLNTTTAISGWVRDINGSGLANINIAVSGVLNGTNYSQTVASDVNGNYSLGVVNGRFQIWVMDCAGISGAQTSYSCPTNNYQNLDITGPGVVVDFTLLPPVQLGFSFRHFSYGGDFADGFTPATHFPISIKGYVTDLLAQYGNPYPPPQNIVFTGPPGSGLTNTPADKYGVGSNFENYFSPNVFSPAIAPGGTWSVTYNGNPTNFTVADPQAASHLFAPVPTVTVTGSNLMGVSWMLKDTSGNLLPGVPAYVTKFQINVFDQDLNLLDSSVTMPPASTQYTLGTPIPWAKVRRVTTVYSDTLGNRFLLNCNRATPTLAPNNRSNGQFQFLASGLAGQNYTVQFSTTLTSWYVLYLTNAPVGLFSVIDPGASDAQRFYRVSVSE